MQTFHSLEEILNFAIEAEKEAYEFYTRLAENAELEHVKNALRGFAQEEQQHKAQLESMKQSGNLPEGGTVTDLKLADYLTDVNAGPDISYQDALVIAMKKEKAAFKLYSDLAENLEDPEFKKAFRALAEQEARHKLRFETEYDDVILKED